MTSKEKARDLYFNYYQQVVDGSSPEHNAKQLAMIAVDEIIRIETHHVNHKWVEYWQEVKQEINKQQ